MKATARAHPIQGLIKYHGLRNPVRNVPYHDSISVCTAPSKSRTTVEFGYETDHCTVNGAPIDDEGAERVATVLDIVRERTGIESGARVVSENSFESNIGLGASASAYAALALAASSAAGLDLTESDLSTLARRGATSAARSVVGGFAHLHTGHSDGACRAESIPHSFDEQIRIIACIVPVYKRTSRAHTETPQSPFFDARRAYVQRALVEMRDSIRRGDFESTFALAERDSLSLLAVTMTGPDGWVYWRPETIELLQLARELREDDIPVFFSADTGATAYLNTTGEYAADIAQRVESMGIESRIWRVGGSPELITDHLF